MSPPAPTARHDVALVQAIPVRLLFAFVVWLVHVDPPLVVARMSPNVPSPPLAPAMKHVDVLAQEMAKSSIVVEEVCSDHVPPPLVVAAIVPLLPTAQQAVVLAQA